MSTTKGTLVALVAALVLMASKSDAAQWPAKKNAAPKMEVLMGSWVSSFVQDGREARLVLRFEANGHCTLLILNENNEVVKSREGEYTFEDGILTISVCCKVIGRERVVSVNAQKLVTDDGHKKGTWTRAEGL